MVELVPVIQNPHRMATGPSQQAQEQVLGTHVVVS